MHPRRLAASAAFVLLAASAAASAEVPFVPPSPPPPRLSQDDLDLQARSNVVQGSGARAFGMGGAFLARADDATAASWNPAGLSYLRRPEVSAVWGAVNSFTGIVQDAATGALLTDDRRRGHAPDFAAATFPFEVHAPNGSLNGAAQLSFQRVISFDGHRTIETGSKDSNVDSSGGFDVIALGSGLQISRKVRIGATLNHWLNGYHQSRVNVIPKGTNQQDLDFELSGWNVHVGVIVSPWEGLNLGAVAKTPFSGNLSLRRFRRDVQFGPTGEQDPNTTVTMNDHAGRGSLNFPGALGFGASWRPLNVLTLSADYTRTYWSNGQIQDFFTLPKQIQDQPPPPVDAFDTLPYPSLFDFTGRGQTDTQQIRSGAEYVVIAGALKVPLRAGYFTDTQYFRGADGVAPRFKGWTAGVGLIVGPLLLDAAYVYESGRYYGFTSDGVTVTTAKDTVTAHRVYVSAIYRHPR